MKPTVAQLCLWDDVTAQTVTFCTPYRTSPLALKQTLNLHSFHYLHSLSDAALQLSDKTLILMLEQQ